MSATSTPEIWFLTGSQELYGQETLDQVAAHSRAIATHLDAKLPLRAVWSPRNSGPWLLAGGAHHTSFSQAVTSEQMEDLASMLGVEHVRIGHGADLRTLKNELRWNEAAFVRAR